MGGNWALQSHHGSCRLQSILSLALLGGWWWRRRRAAARILISRRGRRGVTKKKNGRTGWDPWEGCGKSDPAAADAARAPPTLTLDGRRQEGLKMGTRPIASLCFKFFYDFFVPPTENAAHVVLCSLKDGGTGQSDVRELNLGLLWLSLESSRQILSF